MIHKQVASDSTAGCPVHRRASVLCKAHRVKDCFCPVFLTGKPVYACSFTSSLIACLGTTCYRPAAITFLPTAIKPHKRVHRRAVGSLPEARSGFGPGTYQPESYFQSKIRSLGRLHPASQSADRLGPFKQGDPRNRPDCVQVLHKAASFWSASSPLSSFGYLRVCEQRAGLKKNICLTSQSLLFPVFLPAVCIDLDGAAVVYSTLSGAQSIAELHPKANQHALSGPAFC